MMKPRDIPFPGDLRDETDAAELGSVWRAMEHAAPEPFPGDHTDRAWDALAERIGLAVPAAGAGTQTRDLAEAPSRRPDAPWTRPLLRAAAVAVLALGATAAWYAVPVTRAAAPGELLTLTLPDGSVAELNAGSTLRYRRGFAWIPGLAAGSREVRLEGEAFFRVEPGVRPFRVAAGDAAVRVLGTRFNVRARESAPGVPASVRVEVEEGRVEVWGPGGDRAVILGAGEAARVSPGAQGPVRESVSLERVGLWRSGGLTVVDEPLATILSELSLRFGVRITLLDPDAGTALLSVYYPAVESVETVLADLATQQELRFRRTNDGWELF